ncbi:MAG: FxLYD domain-containing protein [Anaerofustis sp.]
MKRKEPNPKLIKWGIVLLVATVFAWYAGYQYYKMQDITTAVTSEIQTAYQSKFFLVETKYGITGYKVNIVFSNKDGLFDASSWCGCVGTNFLADMKSDHADIDDQINEYYFQFYTPVKAGGFSSDPSYYMSYCANYTNPQEEASVYQIKLALRKGYADSEAEAKTKLEYLKEWSTHEYHSWDEIQLSGEHFRVKAGENDEPYEILPLAKTDTERNPDSTLMWYLDEYASRYFSFSNVSSKIIITDAENKIEINFTFTNNSPRYSQDAVIIFYIYNEQGEVIGTAGGLTPTLAANESGEYVVSETFTDETPSYFRVAYVEYFIDDEDGKYIVFE